MQDFTILYGFWVAQKCLDKSVMLIQISFLRQAVHKQAQRNKAKNLQNVKQSLKAKQPLGTPPPLVHTNTLANNGQKAAGSQKPGKSYNGNSSGGGAAATAALGKEPKQQQQQMPPSTNNSSSGSIPEELLFPMPEDFIKQDSEPFR